MCKLGSCEQKIYSETCFKGTLKGDNTGLIDMKCTAEGSEIDGHLNRFVFP